MSMTIKKTLYPKTWVDAKGQVHTFRVEVGDASWDRSIASVRVRRDKNGIFRHWASAELSIPDLMLAMKAAISEDLVSHSQLGDLQKSITEKVFG